MHTKDSILTRPLARGTICRHAIQCTCPDTGKTGTFLFIGESHHIPGSRCTEVMPDFYTLRRAMLDNGDRFTQVGTGATLAYVWNGTWSQHGETVAAEMDRKYPNLY